MFPAPSQIGFSMRTSKVCVEGGSGRTHATIWTNLKDIILSETSWTKNGQILLWFYHVRSRAVTFTVMERWLFVREWPAE